MAVRDFEIKIVAEAKILLNRPNLQYKHLMEWSTGKLEPQEGEEVIDIPLLGVTASFLKELKIPRVPSRSKKVGPQD